MKKILTIGGKSQEIDECDILSFIFVKDAKVSFISKLIKFIGIENPYIVIRINREEITDNRFFDLFNGYPVVVTFGRLEIKCCLTTYKQVNSGGLFYDITIPIPKTCCSAFLEVWNSDTIETSIAFGPIISEIDPQLDIWRDHEI